DSSFGMKNHFGVKGGDGHDFGSREKILDRDVLESVDLQAGGRLRKRPPEAFPPRQRGGNGEDDPGGGRPPLRELFREGAAPAFRGVDETEIFVDLEEALLLMVITCE